jgi:hypothetical protein
MTALHVRLDGREVSSALLGRVSRVAWHIRYVMRWQGNRHPHPGRLSPSLGFLY